LYFANREKAVVGSDYAFQLANGSLGGIGAQVDDGEADIGITISEMVDYRVQLLSFLHPTDDEQ
jgi:hypothetical protein